MGKECKTSIFRRSNLFLNLEKSTPLFPYKHLNNEVLCIIAVERQAWPTNWGLDYGPSTC